MMTGNKIRQEFLKFFRERDHRIVDGIPLVPTDPSLLLTGAGVVQFRSYIEGVETPTFTRAASCQRCVRTNDIELVGKTAVHCTFFEMLGNFSFGDYYKRETLTWGWEFLVDVCRLDPDRIWGTVYPDDDEAWDIWTKELKVPADRMMRIDHNFWGPVAETGACGPDSEAHYDMGPDVPGYCGRPVGHGKDNCNPDCDCNRFAEVWNHVFTERYKNADGTFTPLPKKNIDTGMGLERLVMAAQGKQSIYETDLLGEIVEAAAKSLVPVWVEPTVPDERKLAEFYKGADELANDWRVRLIAEHSRTIAFMIMDGILPSNEGRGYVLRRVLRRASRYARTMGGFEGFLAHLMPSVVLTMGEAYPELRQKQHHITKIVDIEEDRFWDALQAGTSQLERMLEGVGSHHVLPGKDAFMLYDTFGFPLELTEEMCAEKGVTIDREGFEKAMHEQRTRARRDREKTTAADHEVDPAAIGQLPVTEFTGYIAEGSKGKIVAIFERGKQIGTLPDGHRGYIVTDRTPFYGESGGQVGDTGHMRGAGFEGLVTDVAKVGGVHLHIVEVQSGQASVGDTVDLEVDRERRRAIRRAHTATHLLQYALRQVLGPQVAQSGSLVEPDRLRFDFSHYQATQPDQLARVEDIINDRVLDNLEVKTFEKPIEEAKEMGAIALFGEKYGEVVRLVKTGDISLEFCGGTHVTRTGDIGLVTIMSESSIGAGLRRIEALTGEGARQFLNNVRQASESASAVLHVASADISLALTRMMEDLRARDKEIERLRGKQAGTAAGDYVKDAEVVNGVTIVAQHVPGADTKQIETLADAIADKAPTSIILLIGESDGKVPIVCKVSKDLVKKGAKAGDIVKQVAGILGGGGGGRPDFARGSGSDPSRIAEGLESARHLAREHADH
jgi:alanyl-tRNA synthetase